MEMLYDMHCHLDFAKASEKVAHASQDAGIQALSCTVVPSSYVSDLEKFEGCSNIRLSLGMHPWWVADGRVSEVDMTRFESLLPSAPFIGEIGLDLACGRKATLTRQQEVLERILADIHEAGGGRVITFHVVHAATLIMDMLDRMDVLKDNLVIFHWFQGSHEEFGRAVSTGALMSVGLRMMASEKGSTFAQAIPDSQLLVETDSPPHEGSQWSTDLWSQEIGNTMQSLAELRGCTADELAALIKTNAERVLSYPQP